jgi:hypothetical protein
MRRERRTVAGGRAGSRALPAALVSTLEPASERPRLARRFDAMDDHSLRLEGESDRPPTSPPAKPLEPGVGSGDGTGQRRTGTRIGDALPWRPAEVRTGSGTLLRSSRGVAAPSDGLARETCRVRRRRGASWPLERGCTAQWISGGAGCRGSARVRGPVACRRLPRYRDRRRWAAAGRCDRSAEWTSAGR